MTRKFVYGIGLWAFLAATGMTLAAIIIPDWVTWDAPNNFHNSYGLHSHCNSITGKCIDFPTYVDCKDSSEERHFCSLWRTTGFLFSMAFILELAGIIAFSVALLGGKQRRTQGWKMVGGLVALVGVAQLAGVSIIAWCLEHEDRFISGWKLDRGWVLGVVSAGVQVLVAGWIISSPWFVEEEGGYDLIPDEDET